MAKLNNKYQKIILDLKDFIEDDKLQDESKDSLEHIIYLMEKVDIFERYD